MLEDNANLAVNRTVGSSCQQGVTYSHLPGSASSAGCAACVNHTAAAQPLGTGCMLRFPDLYMENIK